ncbi:MAG: hypothetical protein AB8H86_24110 [Polyangiales bacterium]
MRTVSTLLLFAALLSAQRAHAECAQIPAPGETEQSLDAAADWVFVGDIVEQTLIHRDDPEWNPAGARSFLYVAVTFEVVDALQGDLSERFTVRMFADYSLEPLPRGRYRVRAYDTDRGPISSTRCGRNTRSADNYPTPRPSCSRCSTSSRSSAHAYALMPLLLLLRRRRRRGRHT